MYRHCGALLVAVALWPCAGCSPSLSPGAARRVVIAGAGLAGLTAALDLRDAGWDVVVFEARDRVGGRVRTLAQPFTDGLHAEAGGESIDDNHDQMKAMAARFGLALERRPADKQLGGAVFYLGARSKTSDFVLNRPGVAADYAGFSSSLAALGADLDPEHPELFADAATLDSRSLGDFLAGRTLTPEARFLLTVGNRAGYASELGDVSLLFAVQQAVVTANVPDSASEAMRVSGGNARLPDAMAQALGDRVTLGAPVTLVEDLGPGVRVTAGGRVVEAAYVILAVPTPPLRKIAFQPPLPTELAAAVSQVDLGPAAKVVTQYAKRFWVDEGLSGFTVTDLPFGVGWSSTDSYSGTSGLLSQFITGTPAHDAAALDDASRIAAFQKQLDIVYPEGVAQRSAAAATVAWENEPYTGGAYTVYKPGQMTRFWRLLRKGTTHVRFAGEHTEALAGFMESAVRSGHRVATEIGAPPR